MTKTRLALVCLSSITVLGIASSPASAVVLSLDAFFPDSPPIATAPFGRVEINPIAGGVEFVLTNLTPGTLSGGSSKMDGVYLNYRGSSALTPQAAPLGTSLLCAPNAYKAGGEGWYDILFEYTSNNYLPTYSSVTFSILGDPDPMSFVDFSVPSGNNGGQLGNWDPARYVDFSPMGGGSGGYLAASHLQSTNPQGDSFWAGANQVSTPVPEPASLLLLGAGVTAFGIVLRRRMT